MREIDQIVGLRSKLGFPLLGNPHRPIPHPMDLGLAARSRLQGADRQSLSRFLRASQCGAKNGSHRTRLKWGVKLAGDGEDTSRLAKNPLRKEIGRASCRERVKTWEAEASC